MLLQAKAMDSTLEKLKIESFEDDAFKSAKGSYEVMLNPSSLTQSFSVKLVKNDGVTGNASTTTQFKGMGDQTLTFDFYLDGTGAVSGTKNISSVDEEIKKLKKVVYNYDGEIHQSPFAKVIWGSLEFKGRMESMSIAYTLFLPNGDPLRAKVTMNFTTSKDPVTAAKEGDQKSPDLSRVIEVKIGDTLPRLCQKFYGEASFYLQVARINGLVDFRNLKAGTELIFPPLKS